MNIIEEACRIAKKYALCVSFSPNGTIWMHEGSDEDGIWYADPACVEMAKNEMMAKLGQFANFIIRRDPVPGENYTAVTGINVHQNSCDGQPCISFSEKKIKEIWATRHSLA